MYNFLGYGRNVHESINVEHRRIVVGKRRSSAGSRVVESRSLALSGLSQSLFKGIDFAIVQHVLQSASRQVSLWLRRRIARQTYLNSLMKCPPAGIDGVDQVTLKGIERGLCKKLRARQNTCVSICHLSLLTG